MTAQYEPLLPSTRALLRRYRLKLIETMQPNLYGGQLMRRKGQSLEFRDYVPYLPGDDIRFVDWRASARRGSAEDLVVRSFVAEEQLRLVVSVDTRPSMQLPAALPKLQIALWLAEAISRVAIESGDQVHLHALFDPGRAAPTALVSETHLRRALERLPGAAQHATSPVLNLHSLRPHLPPTAVWLIVTDCYFDSERTLQSLAAEMVRAQAGFCWVLLIDLDTWSHELIGLHKTVWQIAGPEAPAAQRVELSSQNIETVHRKIEQHKQRLRTAARLHLNDWRAWSWPATVQPDREEFFNSTFLNDERIQSIFMKHTL